MNSPRPRQAPFFFSSLTLMFCVIVSCRALQLFATIMDTPPSTTTPTSASGGGGGDVRGAGVGAGAGGGVGVGAEEGVGVGGGGRGGSSGVARSRDCYMAAITACHAAEDFPRALGLLQHMRGKVCVSAACVFCLVVLFCSGSASCLFYFVYFIRFCLFSVLFFFFFALFVFFLFVLSVLLLFVFAC